MAATLSLDTITSSGGTITVPTGKTLAITDAGALTINTVAITTGAQAVLSKTTAYTILAADFTGKSSLIVFVDVSAGTSTETVITLPAAADFSTCAIHVTSTVTHGSGNYITIKNSSAVEQYSLYGKGDHCEFVSDATNVFRTGNEWVTVRGEVALTTSYTLGAYAVSDLWDVAAGYDETEDIGGNWSTVTDDFTAPFAGEFMLAGSVSMSGYGNSFGIKKNGVFIQAVTGSNIAYGINTAGVTPFVLAKNDIITFWISSTSSTPVWYGAAAATSRRTTTNWWCLRRY
jgi:hypothetical protein